MSLSHNIVQEQWKQYLPFLYKFYLEHNELKYVDVISTKWYKEPNQIKSNLLSFIVAGLQKVQHNNQCYKYIVTECIIKSFDLKLPETNFQESSEAVKQSDSQKQTNLTKIPLITERNKIFYQKEITCLEDVIINQKKAIQYETSVTFYAVALKNQSIRFLNASKLAARQSPKRNSFLSERSPFLSKNVNTNNLCVGNPYQAGIIPLQKEVTVIKYNSYDMLLLCGCLDGTIVMINLNYQILSSSQNIINAYSFFTYLKRPVRDLAWMIYSYDQKHSFASVADDGSFYIWNKENITLPVFMVDQCSILPTSLIEVHNDQFILSGRDCMLKFFDIKKGSSYIYNENNEIITKLYNLTDEITYQKSKKQTQFDSSLRFISCEQTGKIVFWQGQIEFEHLSHKGKIASIDFISEQGGMYLAIQKESAKMSIFSPILFTHCLEETFD